MRALSLAAGLMLAWSAACAGGSGKAALEDPLQPPGWDAPAHAAPFDAGRWQLSSTLLAQGRRVAIINGQPVRAGDHVDGARVLAIEAGGVRLDYRGHRFTIQRNGAQVRLRAHGGEE